jgi:hypothetical protein
MFPVLNELTEADEAKIAISQTKGLNPLTRFPQAFYLVRPTKYVNRRKVTS